MTIKKFKRFISIIALLAVGMSVMSGCGGNDQSSSSEEEVSGGETAPEESATTTIDLTDEYKTNMLQYQQPGEDAVIALMETSMGNIRIALYPQIAPKTVENFVTHAQEGYYNGMIFHRVIDSFMIQSGDPTGTGYGGESIYKNEAGESLYFEDEFSDKLFHFRGALSMANPGRPNSNQSQFFIVQAKELGVSEADLAAQGYQPNQKDKFLTDALTSMGYPKDAIAAYIKEGGTPMLDGRHTVFGMVLEGMDTVDAIAATKTGSGDKPITDVVINKVTIE